MYYIKSYKLVIRLSFVAGFFHQSGIFLSRVSSALLR